MIVARYVIYLAIIIAMNSLFDLYIVHLLTVVFVSLLTILIAITLMMRYRIKVYFRDTLLAAYRDNAYAVPICVENRSIFSALKIVLYVTETGMDGIDKIKKIKLSCDSDGIKEGMICSEYHECQTVTYHIKKYRVYDIFGLVCFDKKSGAVNETAILPKKAATSFYHTGFADTNPTIAPHFNNPEDEPELYDIRDYADGDRMRDIHWKMSGSRGKLISKIYGYPVPRREILLIDIANPSADLEELYSRVASCVDKYHYCYMGKKFEEGKIDTFSDYVLFFMGLYNVSAAEDTIEKFCRLYMNESCHVYLISTEKGEALASRRRMLEDYFEVSCCVEE